MDDLSAGLHCVKLGLTLKRSDGTEKTVLRDIDADFKPGRIALISGVTGSGKTSLLHLLAGLLRPSGGQVLHQGRPVSRWTAPHLDRWRRRTGIVFQHPRLFGDLTVLEGQRVAYAAVLHDSNGSATALTDVIWHTSNAQVAGVTPDGVVTALGAGSAVISAVRQSTSDSVGVTLTVVVSRATHWVDALAVDASN